RPHRAGPGGRGEPARGAQPAAREGAGRPGAERLRRARARPPRADAGGAGNGCRPPRRARVNPGDVVQGPIITEKGTLVNEQGNQVVFRVHPHANKVEIRHAIESLFRVKVDKVRTSRQLGKIRRVGRHQGRRPDWKKAYVTLAEGSRIDFFEGAYRMPTVQYRPTSPGRRTQTGYDYGETPNARPEASRTQ